MSFKYVQSYDPENPSTYTNITTKDVPVSDDGLTAAFALFEDPKHSNQEIIAYVAEEGGSWSLYTCLVVPSPHFGELVTVYDVSEIGGSLSAPSFPGDQPMVNIALLNNGNIGINLSKIDDNGSFKQLKFVEVETSFTGLNEIDVQANFPGFSDHVAAIEDTFFSFQLLAKDQDANDQLTFAGLNLPDWLEVSSSGLITGTPSVLDIGQHEVSVQVTDVAGAIDYQTFKIAVANTNDAPVLDDINDQNAYEDTEFIFS